MKTHWRVQVLFISIVFCFAACTSTSLEVRKKQAEAGRNLGEAYLKQGNYTLALREFLKAKELYGNNKFLHDDLGLTYMAKDRLDLAIKHFKKALAIDPGYAPAKNNLGTAYMEKKDWDTAIKYFKEIAGDLLYATPQFPPCPIWAGPIITKESMNLL
ncbi:MAG: tetratricopeptide repeat protein [Deltaproteobacteria bacterium]|nr:tetratricopeptide repeat protein [Deltaproteobacteria bacterium]